MIWLAGFIGRLLFFFFVTAFVMQMSGCARINTCKGLLGLGPIYILIYWVLSFVFSLIFEEIRIQRKYTMHDNKTDVVIPRLVKCWLALLVFWLVCLLCLSGHLIYKTFV
jgi:hypothetical protein